ncbi:hypothetical protein [Segniliparus rugosus]|uniref:Uncharacterized protein n=1 Tax=Segniliparus rugosus (strain ATCC BAA-974 / DSM 45345 / CCUG 50838 / CIP 108380 / JCM 13579 / CDC 945) TaxID=679197 RepID=E5XL18_SEGRC|nr:hypothetical protein [Segniliparus rugosus]EFV15000.1 hypothetical protein HMPREF9336_00187 [Segniliparus rugosus ATCC BAA-974]
MTGSWVPKVLSCLLLGFGPTACLLAPAARADDEDQVAIVYRLTSQAAPTPALVWYHADEAGPPRMESVFLNPLVAWQKETTLPAGTKAYLLAGAAFGSVGAVRGEIVRDGQVLCSGTLDIGFAGMPSPVPVDMGSQICSAEV